MDGDTAAALTAKGWNVFDTLQNNDAYHALQAVGGLIITGATGTNVNDVAVALIGEKNMKVIDAHVHLVQCIAGTGAGGEMRSIGGGQGMYADGPSVSSSRSGTPSR